MPEIAYVIFNMLIHERLEEFCRRLLDAPACSSMEEAFQLLSDIMIAVEDEFSGIAFDPDYPRNDGRMYPPKEDAHRSVEGRADLHRFRSRQHNTYFSEDGAILIVDLDKNVILNKPNQNARRISL